MKKICVGVVGSGAISEIYLKNLTARFPQLYVKAVASANLSHAQKRAEQFGVSACTVDELMADKEIDLIVNLTPVGVHYTIIKNALEAGKHVYTEKTLTDDIEKAAELVALAKEKGLYLGSAPDTFLGSGIQTAKAAIDEGAIGEVTGFAVSANRNWFMLANWFPFLQQKGPGMCYDYLVYHMTALVNLLGPVDSLAASTTFPQPYKYSDVNSSKYGEELLIPNETRVSALLNMRSGVSGTVMMDGDSILDEKVFFRIYGTEGILELGDPNQFGNPVYIVKMSANPGEGSVRQELSPVNSYSDNSRGVGVADMAESIMTGKMTRVDAELAYHVMEVLTGILKSGEEKSFVEIHSTCTKALPFKG